jgi:hypothetical protein
MAKAERVDLFDFDDDKIDILTWINKTNLRELLIAFDSNRADAISWERLDSTLVDLLTAMGSKPLKFFLTCDDRREDDLEELLPRFIKNERVCIDKSLYVTSLGERVNDLRGSGTRAVSENERRLGAQLCTR